MSSLQIQSLSRNIAHYFDTYFSPYNQTQQQINALDFFETYTHEPEDIQKSTINPITDSFVDASLSTNEMYIVDESPLDETAGVLQLKLPMLCSDNTNMYSTPPIGTTNRESNDNLSPKSTTRLTSVYDLALSHITFAVDSLPIQQMIMRIQKVTSNTPEIHEVVQNDNSSLDDNLYTEHLVCICFDSYENHRFAKFIVNLKEVSMHSGPIDKLSSFDALAVEVIHLQGDSRISMEYFKRARFCLSLGDEITNDDYSVDMPDFKEGFSDMYEDVMVSNPNAFE